MTTGRRTTVSIGEAARLCGVSVKQIRHWQAKGYIPEPQRVFCGQRAYRQFKTGDLELIKTIKSYLEEGFRLDIAAQKAASEILQNKEERKDEKKEQR